jgi:outer membrane receptor protein involved in Fe transport
MQTFPLAPRSAARPLREVCHNAARRRRALCASLAMAFALALPAALAAASAGETDLSALSLEDLMHIGVVGASKYEQQQADVAASVTIITRQEIQAHGWRTIDEALSSLPGVATTYDRQYVYPNLRGFGLPGDYATRVLVTINGNRLNDPVQDQAPFGRMLPVDMDLVERIEYIPGPGGAVYGANAMLGVVNIVTRNGADLSGVELAAAAEQPQGQREGRISWGGRLESGIDVLLSTSDLQADGENRFYNYGITGISGVAAGLDYERDRQFFARVQDGAWTMEGEYGARRKGDPTANYSTDPLVPGKFEEDDYGVAQVQYQKTLAESLHLSARAFAGDYRSEGGGTIYGGHYTQHIVGDWRGADVQLLSSAIDRHKLLLGLEFQDDYRLVQALSAPALGINLTIPGSGYRAGLYAQDEWRILDKLGATLGLRIDNNDTTGTQWSPRAGLIWQAWPATTLKALFGRAHRAPSAFERDYADTVSRVANPNLHGEDMDTLEFVADRRIGSDLGLRASLYQWKLHDIITLAQDPTSGLQQYQSGDPVRARGIELSADKTWAADARLRGSISLQHVVDYGEKPPNSPEQLAKLEYTQPLPWAGLRLGAEWQYNGPRRTLNGSELGGWAVTNLNVRAHTGLRGLDASLGFDNLFNKRYAEPAAAINWQNSLEQDGRSVRLKFDYRF